MFVAIAMHARIAVLGTACQSDAVVDNAAQIIDVVYRVEAIAGGVFVSVAAEATQQEVVAFAAR